MRSSEIDYTKISPGIYKHSRSGIITTWDIRIKKPNSGDYLDPAVIHTIEHTMIRYLRDTYGRYRILGVYPMGDQTGFYVLTRLMDRKTIYDAISSYVFNLERRYRIPGASETKCGNYKLQDLRGAKKVISNFYTDYITKQTAAMNYFR